MFSLQFSNDTQETKALLNPNSFREFIDTKVRNSHDIDDSRSVFLAQPHVHPTISHWLLEEHLPKHAWKQLSSLAVRLWTPSQRKEVKAEGALETSKLRRWFLRCVSRLKLELSLEENTSLMMHVLSVFQGLSGSYVTKEILLFTPWFLSFEPCLQTWRLMPSWTWSFV